MPRGGNYRVKIVRAGEELEFEGDKTFVYDMLKRYGETSSAAPITPTRRGKASAKGDQAAAAPRAGRALSVGEFVRQTGLKKHTDLVVAFAYYLEKHGDLKEFTSADINNCYYEAKIESSNTSQMLSQNIKRSFIMYARGSTPKKGRGAGKRYTMTTKGEHFVDSKLNKAAE